MSTTVYCHQLPTGWKPISVVIISGAFMFDNARIDGRIKSQETAIVLHDNFIKILLLPLSVQVLRTLPHYIYCPFSSFGGTEFTVINQMRLNEIFRDNEKAKYAASRLPSTWPSYLHNKCNILVCCFPNSPQAAGGTYNCQGVWGGQSCEGTYYVSPSTAASVMKFSRDRIMRDEAKKWRAQKDAEIERQRIVKCQLDEEARRLAVEELSAKYEEKRRNKDAPTDSPAYNHAVSSYLARRAAQQRRPIDTNASVDHIQPPYSRRLVLNPLPNIPPQTHAKSHSSPVRSQYSLFSPADIREQQRCRKLLIKSVLQIHEDLAT